ncbi:MULTISPECIES: helix-turn-helix domain-containing protein [Streptomyces]|uniref:AraC-like DNA-binding protein n=1 Tax=Streptomyces clavifer TaxID=68188 RepID=A0ABS4VIG8_9ACTN|nr:MULTISPECIES: helix-turn-helix domain-containing protein [Streptomyces]MBP2363719.1 AraC-like DNA-binding protein [Streptomyces clavifer]MDX2747306.1 helix-turn-helix domain-containing protein [Streptomyces sp. NRRL_B-2557]MDX3067379.1 helix-turn-helix domain-containing protein [Streptomyces sp. ND04-05B]RPK86128.1 Transcriptional activator NphR [Streptomyces sp. ADI97-07]WRY86100.1 helix-turn-helix domain-containing protein [Streptomyces clavifer]
MSPVLDTAHIPSQDREEVIRGAVWESVVAVDIDHRPPAEDISVRIGLGTIGPLRICSARATAVTVHRTEQLARKDEEPAVFLGVQMTGTSLVAQNGRECVLRPGEFAMYESIAPYTLLFDEGVDHHFLRFPRAALALPDRLLRDTATVTLGSDNPVARLAFTYFSQLAVSDDLHQDVHADAVVEPSVELLRAVLTSQHGASSLARAPLEATLTLRVTDYIRRHLADPDLSAARIAAAHDISVRHLYAVLSRSGISLGDWIRTRRLAECRRELGGPNARLRTIAAIGRRWGFVNAAHFSTVFKEAYGTSPRAWRDEHHPRSSA